jgi:LmbE family N-acetylglucosaminyl deacetylase
VIDMAHLEVLPEDWERALAVVAHPDDMEYGAASAVARWTAQGKRVSYLLVSDGEAGIESMPPADAGPLRRQEQQASCDAVGVTDLEFLGYPDGMIVESLQLRADLAAAIRRHRPEVVLSVNFRDSWGGSSWNHSDHRAVGRSLLDAVRDAANSWFAPERGPAWPGVRFAAFNGSPQATHAVDVTGTLDAGVRSLECHRLYLDNLGGAMASPAEFLRAAAAATGPRIGVELAASFEVVG